MSDRIKIRKCRDFDCGCGCWIVAWGPTGYDEMPCDTWEFAIEYVARVAAMQAERRTS